MISVEFGGGHSQLVFLYSLSDPRVSINLNIIFVVNLFDMEIERFQRFNCFVYSPSLLIGCLSVIFWRYDICFLADECFWRKTYFVHNSDCQQNK